MFELTQAHPRTRRIRRRRPPRLLRVCRGGGSARVPRLPSRSPKVGSPNRVPSLALSPSISLENEHFSLNINNAFCPSVFPTSKCKLRLLKLERIKDFLLMEEEFIRNQEALRPREEKNEVCVYCMFM
jgi:hypothetical protein